jgi:uncharacterized protein YgiB involved in biofilm formation
LPKDVLEKYNPQSFVVMANSELNGRASQLDKYVNKNPYADFVAGNDCNVPVSKASGETVLVPGINSVFKDGKMVFNLNKCNDASVLIDKVLRKSYCVSLVPVDKNGNKLTEQAVSNCAQTNSLLDLAISEMIEKKLGEFLPSSLIPDDLKPYIKLPDSSDITAAVLGNKDLNLAQMVSFDKLDENIKGYAENFITGSINNEVVSTSIINSMEGMNIWEKQTVLNTLSSKITNEDAKLIFDNMVSRGDLSRTISGIASQTAMEKGIDYLDQSKAPQVLKQAAKTQDPESFAYNELLQAANNQLSSDEKKQLLVDMATTKNSGEVKDALVKKAVQKGCAADYGVSAEQAASCLSNKDIDEVFSDMLSGYNSAPSTRQELLEQSINRIDSQGKSPEVLKRLVRSGDFKGAAQDALMDELSKLPDDSKKAFVSDVLEGKMPDAGTLQSELVKLIPEVNSQYFNALVKDGNIQSLLKDNLEGALKRQLDSFLNGTCVPKQFGLG